MYLMKGKVCYSDWLVTEVDYISSSPARRIVNYAQVLFLSLICSPKQPYELASVLRPYGNFHILCAIQSEC